jgi:hypothetical protein
MRLSRKRSSSELRAGVRGDSALHETSSMLNGAAEWRIIGTMARLRLFVLHPAKSSKYYAIQPGASITFTHLDPKIGSVWHGSVTVKKQKFEGKTFSYSGTFAALWCGKD